MVVVVSVVVMLCFVLVVVVSVVVVIVLLLLLLTVLRSPTQTALKGCRSSFSSICGSYAVRHIGCSSICRL